MSLVEQILKARKETIGLHGPHSLDGASLVLHPTKYEQLYREIEDTYGSGFRSPSGLSLYNMRVAIDYKIREGWFKFSPLNISGPKSERHHRFDEDFVVYRPDVKLYNRICRYLKDFKSVIPEVSSV